MEVHSSEKGFLNDAKYGFHIFGIGKEFEEQLKPLEVLNIELNEILPEWALKTYSGISFSEDKKSCTIVLNFFQYRDKKGKINGQPEPSEVFQRLKFMLNKAVAEYKELK